MFSLVEEFCRAVGGLQIYSSLEGEEGAEKNGSEVEEVFMARMVNLVIFEQQSC